MLINALNKNQKAYLFSCFFIMVISVLTIFFSAVLNHNEKKQSSDGNITSLKESWTIYENEKRISITTLPFTFDTEKCRIEANIPKLNNSDGELTLEIYSNYTDFEVFVRDKSIYKYDNSNFFPKGSGNSYHYITLPNNSEYKRLIIEFSGQLGKSISYLIRPVLIGSKSDMLSKVILGGIPVISIASFMFIISVIIISFSVVLLCHKFQDTGSVHLGFFALIFSMYLFLETKFTSVMLPNTMVVYQIIFLLLALMAIPFIKYFVCCVNDKYKIVPRILADILWMNFLIQLIMHFTGTQNLRAMMPITHLCIIVSVAVMGTVIIMSGKNSRRRSVFVIPVALGGIIDITHLAVNKPSPNNNLFFALGVIVFIITQFYVFIVSYIDMYREAVQIECMKELAYTDSLTGLENRTAYQEVLKKLEEKLPEENLVGIVADINNLKIINDMYGHESGDRAIKAVSGIFHIISDDCIGCYRVGGDEFIAFIEGKDIDEQKLVKKLENMALDISIETGLPFSLAVGCGHYSLEDKDISRFISRIDEKMYEEKKRIKNIVV